ncbi:MAG: diguanylate cyclase [Eubacteriales bacterium]|nr:diguanylate cyclase [Eubacteriales bacterium]
MVFEDLLKSIMIGQGFAEKVFDHIRLVDPVSKKVLAHINNRTKEAVDISQKCHAFFGRSTACENCTSMLAVGRREQVVKVDYADPGIFIALAEPVEYKKKWYVVEILKDITASGIMGMEGEEAVAMNRLLERRNSMLFRDTLTRIYRENFIDTRLPHDLYRVHSEGRTMALFLVSIQNLKEINEKCGTETGDHVLKECAGVLKIICKKPEAWSARYTGSEFVTVTFDPDETRALHACRRLHDRLRKIRLPKGCGTNAVFTIGFYITRGQNMTPEKLISAARRNIFYPFEDRALGEKAALLQKAFPDSAFAVREWEVAALLLAGKSNLEMAQTLFVGLSTVKKHVAGIFDKSQVKTRAQFVAKAMGSSAGALQN